MIPGLFDSIAGAVKGLFGNDGLSGLVDNITTTKEEKLEAQAKLEAIKNAFENKVQEIAIEREKLQMADMADARNREIQIATSDKAPLINKIILPILAAVVTIGFFGILSFMLKYEVPIENAQILNIMLGSLGTAWIGIIFYYFGSSAGSKSKAEQIDKLTSK